MAVKKRKVSKKDPKKEALYKQLAADLQECGYTVRREKLKQGSGWKVMSGECMVRSEQIIFVDSRMTQDDQISFLSGKLQVLRPAASTDGAGTDSEGTESSLSESEATVPAIENHAADIDSDKVGVAN